MTKMSIEKKVSGNKIFFEIKWMIVSRFITIFVVSKTYSNAVSVQNYCYLLQNYTKSKMKIFRFLFMAIAVILGIAMSPARAGELDSEQNINLLFIGNSITAGATLSNAGTQAPPIVCGKLIGNATGVKTNVYNGGHSGITTLGFLPGRDDFERLVKAAKAYVQNNGGLVYISIMLGTNDSACTTTEGAPVSTSTYRANIKAIIEKLLEEVPTCKILLNYPIWYSPNTYNSAMYLQEGLDRLHSYYPILDGIVEEYDRVYAGYRGVWEFFEDNTPLFTAENGNAGTFYLHPNVTGATRLAEIWANSLLKLIEDDGVEIQTPVEVKSFQPQNDKKYSFKTSRGDYGTKDGVLTNTVKTGIDATKGEFAFLSRGNQTFLYSIADQSFMYRNPTPYKDDWSTIICSNEFLQPIKVHYTGKTEAYPYLITMGDYWINSAAGTTTGVVANTWKNYDAGNQTAIIEEGDWDPTEALAVLDAFLDKQLTVTYRIQDACGKALDELTDMGLEGEVISEVPARVPRKPYTTYTVLDPVTLVKGQDNVVHVTAIWTFPFELSPDINNAKWYNLALREGADYVNAAEGYKCNTAPMKSEVMSDEYQWAFQGDPYDGIVVFNRSDLTKTLAKVGDVAILADGVFKWKITESAQGFLLSTEGSEPYINEYGGAGGHLGFWHNVSDAGSIFSVSEVGSLTVENIRLSTGARFTLYKSDDTKSNGRAVLVIPGGGYSYVAGSSEGADWVPMLNELGYTAAVLTYTTPPAKPDGPLNEACEAMKYLRDHPEECNTSTGQIGVMGFSAGGHLASTVATHTTGDSIPAFQILFYPVITMNANYTHAGSRSNLIGNSPRAALVNLYSNEKQVTSATPICYLCWADDDTTVPPYNSKVYAKALKTKGVPYHSKNFPSGGHGYGFKLTFQYHDEMVADLTEWMQDLDDYLTAVKAPAQTWKSAPSRCYDLGGRLVGGHCLKPGLYIADQHTVLVK